MPERFSDGTGKYLYQFLPFSTGPRMCPVKSFMVTIMKTFLITFIESVKIETANTNHNEGHILQDIKVTTIKEVQSHFDHRALLTLHVCYYKYINILSYVESMIDSCLQLCLIVFTCKCFSS
jgi:hypothetical protein